LKYLLYLFRFALGAVLLFTLKPVKLGLLRRNSKNHFSMLRSHKAQEQTFDHYASFLRNILDGQDRYKPLVEPVVKEAKSLAKNEKDYFTISRNGFEVIVFLAKKDPEFFTNLNTSNISNGEYRHILNLITAQRDLIVA
jgi:hypothetical protein